MTADPKETLFAAIRADLKEGWGVEDISIRRQVTADTVRDYIGHLRRCGDLEALVRP